MSTSRAASTSAALLLAATLGLTACTGSTANDEPADLASASTETSTPSSRATDEVDKVEKADTVVGSGKVWPRWDPRDVAELPRSVAGSVPALPPEIDPPRSSPLLANDPMGAAVLAVERGGEAQLLSPDGAWRTVPLQGKNPSLQLSPNGTRLAVLTYRGNTFDLVVHGIGTGRVRTVPLPKRFSSSEGNYWFFRNEKELLLGGGGSTYLVAVDGEPAERLPYQFGLSQAVDPSGNLLVSAQWGDPNLLTDYRPATPREVSMRSTGRLSSIRAAGGTVVGASYDKRPFALVIADRKTLAPRTSLPVLDFQGNYSNWGLGTLAIVDDERVLLRVAALGQGGSGFYIVAFDPSNGALSIVSSTDLPPTAYVVFAEGLLRQSAD